MPNATRIRILVLVALLAVPLLVFQLAGTSARAGVPGWAVQYRRQQMAQIVADLQPHGLVYDLNRTVTVGGVTVTLRRLAVDRDIAFLETGQDFPPNLLFSLSSSDGTSSIASPSAVFSRFDFQPDPNVPMLTLQVHAPYGATAPADTIQIPVDLSALTRLPNPQSIPESATTNGVRIEAGEFRRGYAVSSLALHGTVVNVDNLQLSPMPQRILLAPSADPAVAMGEAWPLRVSAHGTVLPVIGSSVNEFDAQGWHSTVDLLDVPPRGGLELNLAWIMLSGLGSSNPVQMASGPWNLSLTLPQSK